MSSGQPRNPSIRILAPLSLVAAFVIGLLVAPVLSPSPKKEADAPTPETATTPDPIILPPKAPEGKQVVMTRVTRGHLEQTLHFPGKIVYDRRNMTTVVTLVEGRVEALGVEVPGGLIEKGAPLASLFSSQMLNAQRRYLEALDELGDRPAYVRSAASDRVLAATERLLAWGLSYDDLDAIEKRGEPSNLCQIQAPAQGRITSIHKNRGAFVMPGDPLYTLTDTSTVWLEFAVDEARIQWLKINQTVQFQLNAAPDQIFEGPLVYLGHGVETRTRTKIARARISNPNGLLKQGMLAQATIHATLGATRQDPSSADQWVSPIDVDYLSDTPGVCPQSGLPLVKRSNFFLPDAPTVETLLAPRSAVMQTGTRQIVFVPVEGEPAQLEAKEIVAGLFSDDWIVVLSGLEEGDQIAVNANFIHDAESDIHAMPRHQ